VRQCRVLPRTGLWQGQLRVHPVARSPMDNPQALEPSQFHVCSCLALLLQVDEWATAIADFVRTYGLSESVMTLDELSTGDDVRGTGATKLTIESRAHD
jgi:hypothetical protein